MVKKKVQANGHKIEEKRNLVEKNNKQVSVRRQCELLGLSHSTYYYKSQRKPECVKYDEEAKRRVLELYEKRPFYGKRRISNKLKENGFKIGREKTGSIMKELNIRALAPQPNLSIPNKEHKIYPYLLRGVEINSVNQVWSTDITYIKLPQGFVYLTAVIDWHSRYVLSWRLSTTLDGYFCREVLKDAIMKYGGCEIFNTDQGCQYTDSDYTQILIDNDIKISMDGKGRALDNIFVERLWRTVKYEEIYLSSYSSVSDLRKSLEEYFRFYNGKSC